MILVWPNYYLVGGWPTPLKNMSSSVGMIFPNMEKNVPNHKPVMVIITSSPTVSLISLISLVLNANIAKWAPPCTATRWVSNLLCRWARRFSFSPSQRFSVSPGNKGQWWFHWLWNYWQVLHSLQLYTIVPYIFCILSAEIVAGRVAVFSMVGYLDNKKLAMKHIWLSCWTIRMHETQKLGKIKNNAKIIITNNTWIYSMN